MAWKNGQGRAWARVVATIFIVVNTLSMPGTAFLIGAVSVGSVSYVASMILGVTVLILLWRRTSSDYYKAVSKYRLGML